MAHDDVAFRPAGPGDLPALTALLGAAGLPTADLGLPGQDYLLAFQGGALVGSVGLEKRGALGLLRSLAVVPEQRRRGLGGQLYDRIVAHAAASGVGEAYLLTTTAERFFAARGFERVERAR